jgi:hypothetical protein
MEQTCVAVREQYLYIRNSPTGCSSHNLKHLKSMTGGSKDQSKRTRLRSIGLSCLPQAFVASGAWSAWYLTEVQSRQEHL